MIRAILSVAVIALLTIPAVAEERPNILLIVADDLGFSDLGCYGGEIATPHLDALAKDGLRFRQFYNCARCCPSRASLMTGLYPHQAGVGDMNVQQNAPGYRGFPQPNTVTIAEVLRAAGYHTSLVGKWHLSAGPRTPRPTDRGFDEFYGMIGGFNSCFQEDPFYTRLPAGRLKRHYAKDQFYSTDVFGDYSLDFLAEARKQKRPFFQYLAFNAPHFPLHAKPDDIAKYADTYTKGWDKVREERLARQEAIGLFPKGTPLSPRSPFATRADFYRTGENPAWDTLDADGRADLARRMAIFAGMVTCMDRNIGRVLDDLKTHGELDNTLVLFLSDNGACAEWDPFGFDGSSGPKNILHKGEQLETMGSAKTYHSYGSGWANAGNTPFRLYKHYCHEGGIRTPLITHWPSGFAAKGEYRDQPGHLIDLMATFVEVARANYPTTLNGNAITPMEGTSLTPSFANKSLDRELLAWEHERNRAIRVGKWKLVAEAGHEWELFDIEADPVEMTNLATKQPETVKDLAGRWEAWANRCNVVPYPVRPRTHVFLACGGETRIIDGTGKVTWRYAASSRDGWVLDNGNVLLALSKSQTYPGGAAVIVTHDGKTVFEFRGTQSEVNTVQPLAEGRILITEAGPEPRLLEVDRTGKIVFEVPLQAQTRDQHLQTRMARKLDNGNYLIPQLLDRVVREYSPEGKVVWEVKTPDMPFTAIRLADGHTLIGCTLGNLVIEVDRAGKTVWQVTNDDLPGRPINDACGVQRLPNGNTVITSHHATANQVKLTEVTPAKAIVWTYTDDRPSGIHHFQILETNGRPIGGKPLR
jgi:arylsulfatase A-like enzyme